MTEIASDPEFRKLSLKAEAVIDAGLKRKQISLLCSGKLLNTSSALQLPWCGLAYRTEQSNRWALTPLGQEVADFIRNNWVEPID